MLISLKKYRLLIAICAAAAAGAAIGAAAGARGFGFALAPAGRGLGGILFSNLRIVVLVWLCGFMAVGAGAALGLCFVKSMTCAYSAAAIAASSGAARAFVLVSLSSLAVIPVVIILAHFSMSLALYNVTARRGKRALGREKRRMLTEQLLLLPAAVLVMAGVSAMQAYILPVFCV